MKEIQIPFNKWSAERLSSGQKVCTSRTKKYGEPMDFFVVDGKRYVLMRILELPLWFIVRYLWHQEGASSPEEFVKVWKSIHPRAKIRTDILFYVHFFDNPNNEYSSFILK